MRLGSLPTAAALVALAAACAPSLGQYVWYDQYRASQKSAGPYVVAAGDLISVRVFNQDAMSAKVRVRADGRISLPFLGDVDAAGLQPVELAKRLQTLLTEFVVNPVVTVSLEEARPLEVYVIGEVAKPGRYPVESNASVLHALAAAGGLTAFATSDRIFVLRREPKPARIRFTLEALTRNQGEAGTFRLVAGDTVVVE